MKLAYDALSYLVDSWERKWWYIVICHSLSPLKIRLFAQLLIHNKILTWDNLIKWGWLGLGWCVLCGIEEESISHVFVSCYFSKLVWNQVLNILKISGFWEAIIVEHSLWTWICDQEVANCRDLSFYIWWGFWLYRNMVIFYNGTANIMVVVSKILGVFKERVQKKIQISFMY